jgi:hypothetical protein
MISLLLLLTNCKKTKDETIPDETQNVVILYQDHSDSIGLWEYFPDSSLFREDTSNIKINDSSLEFTFMINNKNNWGGLTAINNSIGQDKIENELTNLGLKVKLNYGSFQNLYMDDTITNIDGYRIRSIIVSYGNIGITFPSPISSINNYNENLRVIDGEEFDIWISEDSLVVNIDGNIVYDGEYGVNEFASYINYSSQTLLSIYVGNLKPDNINFKDSISIDYIELYTYQ